MTRIPVLDHGFVESISFTEKGDLLVVNAARCSFDKEHREFDMQKDSKLLNYLAREKHVLPFRHPSATLRIHAPVFVLRQLGKHQVGFSWSEVSRRYIKGDPEFFHPDPWEWRPSAEDIKQGSKQESINPYDQIAVEDLVTYVYENAKVTYDTLLERGVSPEMARVVLPQSMYTTTVTTGTLLGWHHMYTLRAEKHTQLETQAYAEAIGLIMKKCFPHSWDALCEHS